MKKRILSMFIVALLVFSALPAAAFAGPDDTYNADDCSALQDFLTLPSAISGQTNAEALGYDISSPYTWSDVVWTLSGTEYFVKSIDWSSKSIAGSLDVTGRATLEYLNVSDTEVTNVDCSQCSLSELHVTGCYDLTMLHCSENDLTSLDLDGCSTLTGLDCSLNGIDSLDLTECPILHLDCQGNPITLIEAAMDGDSITLNTIGQGYVELFCDIGVLNASAVEDPSGLSFTKWISGGEEYSNLATIALTPGDDYNLTAVFGYTLFYNANGATGGTVPASAMYDSADEAVVAGNTGNLVKTGYEFCGWNTENDGDGVHYDAGDTITIGEDDITLYAEWEEAEYSVTYNANGATTGTAPIDTNAYASGESFTTKGNTGNLQKINYTFAGWNTAPDGTGTHYGAPGPITMPAGDLILYAEWEDGYYNADVAKVKAFLVQNSHVSGKTNAQMLGCNPNGFPSTWSGLSWVFGSDDLMHLSDMEWYDCDLAGTLDLSGCAYLDSVDCSMNYLKSVNVNGCTELTMLDCCDNELTSLNIGGASKLEYLDCSENKLASLNTSGANKLEELYCYDNKLTSLVLDVADSLYQFDCSGNLLTSINVAGRRSLEAFACGDNKLTSLNLTGCTGLEGLFCWGNNLSSLNLAPCSKLQWLDCSENKLKSLNTGACPDLMALFCSDNALTSLGIASNKYLLALDCAGNSLTSLSISQKLVIFRCIGNPMTSLGVSLVKENSSVIPVTLKASGSGYVGLIHRYEDDETTAVATPKEYYSFSKWTKSGKTASTKAAFDIKSSGTYIAEFAYKRGVYLSGVTLSAGKMSPAFSKTKTSYKITLPENQGSVTITPQKISGNLGMTINGKSVSSYQVNLANGKSATVKVKVSYGKSSKTYKFTVTRAKSTNNNLVSLKASTGTFDSAFNPSDTSYVLTLGENVKSTKITAAAAAGKLAKVSPSSKTVSLKNGASQVVKIKVKSQAGKYKTYTIKVVRAPSTNNNLSYLKTSSKSLPLSPKFAAGTANYSITLPVDKSTVTISAKAAGYKAAVYIDGKKASSKKITLKAGASTTVRVVVKAQSKAEKVYTITINRLISSDANLKSLKTSSKSASLSPAFSPNTTGYTVALPAKSSSVTLYASASGYGAKVTFDGKSASSKKITLKNGESKTVRIVVKSQAGNTKEYVITVTRTLT